ncbi:MAG: hypothetical protein GXP29_01550 [Planctomycetes bacterium]|nr:hypothetical protein [Planctomycetota bacterium]
MAVDLKLRNSFGNVSIILMDDHLVELEHSYTSDRVRRIRYDRVESVVRWRVLPLGRMAIVGLLVAVPGLLMMFSSEQVFVTMGTAFLTIAACIEAIYIYAGKTHISIMRAGREFKLAGVVRPHKVDRLLNRMEADIRRTQEEATPSTSDESIELESTSESTESDTASPHIS